MVTHIVAYTLENRGHTGSVSALVLYTKALELLQECDSSTFVHVMPSAPAPARKSLKSVRNLPRLASGYGL